MGSGVPRDAGIWPIGQLFLTLSKAVVILPQSTFRGRNTVCRSSRSNSISSARKSSPKSKRSAKTRFRIASTRPTTVAEILTDYGTHDAATLEDEHRSVRVAGRLVTLRLQARPALRTSQGGGERLQIYVKLDVVGERGFQLFRLLDIGDMIGVSGHLFRTKTNELTVWVEQLTLLTKALLPLPEKWHGLADVSTRYRQRYLDLIANPARAKYFPAARRDSARAAPILRRARLYRSGNAHDADHRGRGGGAALYHSPQYP